MKPFLASSALTTLIAAAGLATIAGGASSLMVTKRDPCTGADGLADNPRSSLAFLKGRLPTSITPRFMTHHIGARWSFAQFRLPSAQQGPTRSVCAFSQSKQEPHTFFVVESNGTFFRCKLPKVGGECEAEDWQRCYLPDGSE